MTKITKNKKLLLFGGVAVLCIVILVAVLCIAFFNGNNGDTDLSNARLEETILQELSGLSASIIPKEDNQMLLALEEKRQCTVKSYEQTDGAVVATVLVKAPDLYALAQELSAQETEWTEETLQQAFTEGIKDAKLLETEVKVTFEQIDGKWKPVFDNTFIDAYYGGILKIRTAYFEEVMGERA